MECKDTQIDLEKALRRADLKEASSQTTPSIRGCLAGPVWCAPLGEAFSPITVKDVVSRLVWQSLKSTPTSRRFCIHGVQLGWQGRRHTKILQDLGIKVRLCSSGPDAGPGPA
jgi:hypothetical protein